MTTNKINENQIAEKVLADEKYYKSKINSQHEQKDDWWHGNGSRMGWDEISDCNFILMESVEKKPYFANESREKG